MHIQRALLRAPPAVPQWAHRQGGVPLLRALMLTAAFTHQKCECTLNESPTQTSSRWSQPSTSTSSCASPPGQRYLHSLPQLLEAFAAQLLRRSPYAAPALRDEHIIRHIVHQEISLLQQESTMWQSLRPWSGSKFASCGAPFGNNFDIEKNPTLVAREGTNWQQPMSPLSHSISLLKRAKSAWQPCSCQSLSTAGSAT